MVSYVKLEKIIADLVETANTVKAADFAALKDVQIGKLYFATESLIGAVESFIEKIDTEIMKRDDIVIPEIGQKIVKESEPVLKIKKLSKAEITAAAAPAAAKPKAAAKPAAKPKAAAPASAKPKAAAPAKAKEVK